MAPVLGIDSSITPGLRAGAVDGDLICRAVPFDLARQHLANFGDVLIGDETSRLGPEKLRILI
jgi:hypothetical protein